MKRTVVIILLLLGLIAGAAVYFGWTDRVTEAEVARVLEDKGVPPKLAGCMADRMVERLTISQLYALKRLEAQEGETSVPLSPAQLIERLKRVDDPEAVEVTIRAAAGCSLGLPL